ncbi:hypothetical protein ACSNOK_13050 [Streptomyces sp. URMC 126]
MSGDWSTGTRRTQLPRNWPRIRAYADVQCSLGFTGPDADGIPRARVPA